MLALPQEPQLTGEKRQSGFRMSMIVPHCAFMSVQAVAPQHVPNPHFPLAQCASLVHCTQVPVLDAQCGVVPPQSASVVH